MKRLLWVGLVAVAGCSVGPRQPPMPPNWPDLTVLTDYPNRYGDTCSVDGLTRSGGRPMGANLDENRRKNRFVPPGGYNIFVFDQFLRTLPPEGASYMNDDGVAITGYVRDVKPGGTRGESCNCGATRKELVDAHIEIVDDPRNDRPDGKGMVVVEVTERSRRLAERGLLVSNIGNDWSTRQLRSRLLGRWVRFRGWLLFDSDHVMESWSADPDDTMGGANWRGSAWEIHPVMGIEVVPGQLRRT